MNKLRIRSKIIVNSAVIQELIDVVVDIEDSIGNKKIRSKIYKRIKELRGKNDKLLESSL